MLLTLTARQWLYVFGRPSIYTKATPISLRPLLPTAREAAHGRSLRWAREPRTCSLGLATRVQCGGRGRRKGARAAVNYRLQLFIGAVPRHWPDVNGPPSPTNYSPPCQRRPLATVPPFSARVVPAALTPRKIWLIKTANYEDACGPCSVIGSTLRLPAIAAAGHRHTRRLGDGAAFQTRHRRACQGRADSQSNRWFSTFANKLTARATYVHTSLDQNKSAKSKAA